MREPEGGYSVIVPSLPGCFTQGETVQESLEMAKEAIECHLESFLQHGEAVPEEGAVLSFEPEGVTEGFFFRVTAHPEVFTYA
jgi:predicted RNase H-like HicB family nuclease